MGTRGERMGNSGKFSREVEDSWDLDLRRSRDILGFLRENSYSKMSEWVQWIAIAGLGRETPLPRPLVARTLQDLMYFLDTHQGNVLVFTFRRIRQVSRVDFRVRIGVRFGWAGIRRLGSWRFPHFVATHFVELLNLRGRFLPYILHVGAHLDDARDCISHFSRFSLQ